METKKVVAKIEDAEDFKLIYMAMKNADDRSTVFWEGKDWNVMDTSEKKVELPADMLKCRAISREI